MSMDNSMEGKMEKAVPESKWPIIWKAIGHWCGKFNLDPHYLSLLTAGSSNPPYMPDRIARGITSGTEPISPEFLRACVFAFRIVKPQVSLRGQAPIEPAHLLTQEDCIELLIEPVA